MSKRVNNAKGAPSKNRAVARMGRDAREKLHRADQLATGLIAEERKLAAEKKKFDKAKGRFTGAGFLSRLRQAFRPRSI